MNQAAPIFIAGCGRSGTTYLKTIVDAHDTIFIPTESLFIADYLRYGAAVPRGLLRWLFYREPQLRAWYDGPSEPVESISETVGRVHRWAASAEGKTIWGQKTPRFVRHMDLFRQHFPGCRFILIYRDPRAVVASMLKSPRHTYSVARACRRWMRDNQPVYEHLQSPREDTLVISYEGLVQRYDAHLERIFGFLGIRAMSRREVIERGRVRELKGSRFQVAANNVREGLEPHVKSIDSWKNSLTEAQVREVERRCAREMKLLGYRPLPSGALTLKRRRFDRARLAIDATKDVLIVYEYLRHWPYYPIHTAIRKVAMSSWSGLRRLAGGHAADRTLISPSAAIPHAVTLADRTTRPKYEQDAA